ncbi:MAG: hypothetical protein IKJ35_04880 [Clostridia bacterium]|nr:hypothetical protein [Clostridia bacterium]
MIKILIRARFGAMLASMIPKRKNKDSAKKSGKGTLVLMLLVYLYLFFVFGMLFFSAFLGLSMFYLPTGNAWMYFSMFVILSFAMMFIGSVFMAKSEIFEAKDNEMLLSMPIRPRDILASRMLGILLLNYVMEALVAIPCAVVWILFGGGSILSWIAFLLTVLALPFFGLAVTCLIAWVISLITSRLPKSPLLPVALFLIFFFGYFYLISNMETYLERFAAQGDQIAHSLQSIAPLYWVGAGIANANLWQLGLSLLIYLLPFVLTYYVLSRTLIKILTTKRGVHYKKTDISASVVAGGMKNALLKRELSRLLSSITYLLNSGISALFLPIAAIAAVIKRGDILAIFNESGLTGMENVICLVMVVGLTLIASMVLFTSASVSLEGKHLWVIRSLPVSSADILRAKLKLHYVIMVPTCMIFGLVVAIAYAPALPIAVMLVTLPALYCVWCANIGLICNLCHPVLDWINEAQVVKQGTAVMLTMLFSTLPVFVLAFLGGVLALISYWLSLIFLLGVMILGIVLSYRYLMHGGVARWDSLVN